MTLKYIKNPKKRVEDDLECEKALDKKPDRPSPNPKDDS